MESIRNATAEDLDAVLAILADDELAKQRGSFAPGAGDGTVEAFHQILSDLNQELLVVERESVVIAVAQVTYLRYLAFDGGWRAHVEGVRVAAEHRGQGVGSGLFVRICELARARGCHLVQLMSDQRRTRARGFYERLGFQPTHLGFKLGL